MASPRTTPRIPASESLPNFMHQIIDDRAGRPSIRLCEQLGAGAFGKVYRGEEMSPPTSHSNSSHSRSSSSSAIYSSFGLVSKATASIGLGLGAPPPLSSRCKSPSNSPSATMTRKRRHSFAVKCLAKQPPNTRAARLQSRELALHRRVSAHQSIVSMHRVLSDEEHIYVLLDLHSGGDLFSAITEKRRYCGTASDYSSPSLASNGDGERVRRDFLQIVNAVAYCHEKGVYHRDIKPENVLCGEGGEGLYLADFGLSTEVEVTSSNGCGSTFYMSPECIGKEYRVPSYSTPQTDVWALGIILINMLSGRSPWRLASLSDECFSSYVDDPANFLMAVLPISPDVNDILRGVFEVDWQARMGLAELRERIESVPMGRWWASAEERKTAGRSWEVGFEERNAVAAAVEAAANQEIVEELGSEEVYLFGSLQEEDIVQSTIRVVPQRAQQADHATGRSADGSRSPVVVNDDVEPVRCSPLIGHDEPEPSSYSTYIPNTDIELYVFGSTGASSASRLPFEQDITTTPRTIHDALSPRSVFQSPRVAAGDDSHARISLSSLFLRRSPVVPAPSPSARVTAAANDKTPVMTGSPFLRRSPILRASPHVSTPKTRHSPFARRSPILHAPAPRYGYALNHQQQSPRPHHRHPQQPPVAQEDHEGMPSPTVHIRILSSSDEFSGFSNASSGVSANIPISFTSSSPISAPDTASSNGSSEDSDDNSGLSVPSYASDATSSASSLGVITPGTYAVDDARNGDRGVEVGCEGIEELNLDGEVVGIDVGEVKEKRVFGGLGFAVDMSESEPRLGAVVPIVHDGPDVVDHGVFDAVVDASFTESPSATVSEIYSTLIDPRTPTYEPYVPSVVSDVTNSTYSGFSALDGLDECDVLDWDVDVEATPRILQTSAMTAKPPQSPQSPTKAGRRKPNGYSPRIGEASRRRRAGSRCLSASISASSPLLTMKSPMPLSVPRKPSSLRWIDDTVANSTTVERRNPRMVIMNKCRTKTSMVVRDADGLDKMVDAVDIKVDAFLNREDEKRRGGMGMGMVRRALNGGFGRRGSVAV